MKEDIISTILQIAEVGVIHEAARARRVSRKRRAQAPPTRSVSLGDGLARQDSGGFILGFPRLVVFLCLLGENKNDAE